MVVRLRTRFLSATGLLLLSASAFGQAPIIAPNGVRDAAELENVLVPGGLGTVFGEHIAPATAQADAVPLGTALGGATMTVGGIPAPLLYVSPTQINFQVPFEVPLGVVPVVVSTPNGSSMPVQASIGEYALRFFTYARSDGTRDPIFVHADNELVTPANEAVPGETIVVYGTGIGKLTRFPPTGGVAPADPPARAIDTPVVLVDRSPARVAFAGLTPGSVGLAQLNIQMPSVLRSGTLPVEIFFPNASILPLRIAVKGNAAAGPLVFSPSPLAFGDVNVGLVRDLTVSVQNTGNTPVTISGITLTSGNGFSLMGPTPLFPVAPGATFVVTLRFAPMGTGAVTNLLVIISNALMTQWALPVTGTGADPVPAPALAVAPVVLDFGNVSVGQSRDLTVTVRNTGAGVLNVSSIVSANARFTVLTAVPFDVAPGEASIVTVRFSPTGVAELTANLAITANDPARAIHNVSLRGAGVRP